MLCVEVEAAGLMDQFPCLVIQGICAILIRTRQTMATVRHGKMEEAATMYLRALHGYGKGLGAGHASTLDKVKNLGNLYAAQGKMAEAGGDVPAGTARERRRRGEWSTCWRWTRLIISVTCSPTKPRWRRRRRCTYGLCKGTRRCGSESTRRRWTHGSIENAGLIFEQLMNQHHSL